MAVQTVASNGGTSVGNTTYYSTAFTFITPDETYDLTSIAIPLANSDPQAATTTTVALYSVDVDHKPDALLATMGTIASSALTISFVNKTFAGGTYELVPLTEYAIVISVEGDSGCSVRWQGGGSHAGVGWSIVEFEGGWEGSSERVFVVYGTYHNPPPKATTPDPADDAVDVSAALDVLLWETSGQEDSVDVYFGEAGSMALLEATWTEGTYYVISGLEAGHEYEWRIDTTNEAGTTTGDAWSFTVASSYAVTPVAPVNEATGEKIIANGLSWDSVDVGVVFDVLFREFGTTMFTTIAEGISDLLFAFPYNLTYNQIYFWKIEEYTVDPGTGEKTLVASTAEQYFTTEALIEYPIPSRRTVPDGLTPPGTMSVITGENCLAGIRRIVVACNDEIWYEAIE